MTVLALAGAIACILPPQSSCATWKSGSSHHHRRHTIVTVHVSTSAPRYLPGCPDRLASSGYVWILKSKTGGAVGAQEEVDASSAGVCRPGAKTQLAGRSPVMYVRGLPRVLSFLETRRLL